MANWIDLYIEGKFRNEADPKDGFPVRECRDPKERRSSTGAATEAATGTQATGGGQALGPETLRSGEGKLQGSEIPVSVHRAFH